MTAIRIEGDRKSAIETGRNRLMVAGALFVAAFGVIAVRMIDVSLIHTEEPAARRAADVRPSDGRADIFDRNGVLLATSVKTSSLYANPRKIQDARRAAGRLSEVLPDLDRTQVEKNLMLDQGFVWIRRHLTPRLKYEINRLGIPGLDFQNETRRLYPLGGLAATSSASPTSTAAACPESRDTSTRRCAPATASSRSRSTSACSTPSSTSCGTRWTNIPPSAAPES